MEGLEPRSLPALLFRAALDGTDLGDGPLEADDVFVARFHLPEPDALVPAGVKLVLPGHVGRVASPDAFGELDDRSRVSGQVDEEERGLPSRVNLEPRVQPRGEGGRAVVRSAAVGDACCATETVSFHHGGESGTKLRPPLPFR